MKVFKEDHKIIKSWCEPDENTLDQARNLARLPFTYKHVALMADAHLGYGMPIGGVLATRGVVIPNAVGVDIGCLDCETEFLTKRGWKRIDKFNGEEVLQYEKETDTGRFVVPDAYIKKECSEFYHFKNNKGLDQMLSEEHKVLVWKGYKKKGYNLLDVTPVDLYGFGKKLEKGYYGIKCSLNIVSDGLSWISDNEIMLDVMIAADGCIRKKKKEFNIIELHLKKKRKISRAKLLLENCNIPYKLYNAKDLTVYIVFNVPKYICKDLSKYWEASRSQLKILANESLLWDGYKGYRSYFSSSNESSSDIVQFAFFGTNVRAGVSVVKNSAKNRNDNYIVTPTKNNIIGITNHIKKVKSVDGFKYCFTVPSGYFVARRNGRIFITGNCGMAFKETTIKVSDVKKSDLIDIVSEIRTRIPVGFKKHETPIESPFIRYADISNILPFVDNNDTFKRSMGTLGGGNHFIELQKNESGNLCIMIHSGSRNLGKRICDYYNDIAKKMNKRWYSSVLVEHDLAFLPVDTRECQDYLHIIDLAMEYAKTNRFIMMSKVEEVLSEVLDPFDVNFGLDVHHNYVSLENHFDNNVYVHRKGAIKAGDNYGIIPGSQGTKSYIVKGKSNKQSYMSCSHGAGRLMGRKQAKKELFLEHELELMNSQGIIHSIKSNDDLDESPSAYKDIDEVMKNQEDLVDVVNELRPIAVVKG